MVATDNSNIAERIINHVKCPYCRSQNIMGDELYQDNNRLMCEFLCEDCMDKKEKVIEYSVPMINTAKIEMILLPNGRQQLYFHVYEESTIEDNVHL